MDGVTERKITALILEEAARLKHQADEEGIRAYLNPKKRYRPNSRFLQSTVLSVEQANKSSQVSDMWRLREEELGHSDEPTGKRRRKEKGRRMGGHPSKVGEDHPLVINKEKTFRGEKRGEHGKSAIPDLADHPDELDDLEMEKFLQARKKRGRGSVGARMDTTGPYPGDDFLVERIREKWEESASLPMPTFDRSLGDGDKWQRGEGFGDGERLEHGAVLKPTFIDTGTTLPKTRKSKKNRENKRHSDEAKDKKKEKRRKKEKREEKKEKKRLAKKNKDRYKKSKTHKETNSE